MVVGPAAKLIFTSAEQTVTVNSSTSLIKIQTQDACGAAVDVDQSMLIGLSSTSGNTGEFYTFQGGVPDWRGPGDTIVSLADGDNAIWIKYRDAQAGQPVLTAEDLSGALESGTYQITVNPEPTHHASNIRRSGDHPG